LIGTGLLMDLSDTVARGTVARGSVGIGSAGHHGACRAAVVSACAPDAVVAHVGRTPVGAWLARASYADSSVFGAGSDHCTRFNGTCPTRMIGKLSCCPESPWLLIVQIYFNPFGRRPRSRHIPGSQRALVAAHGLLVCIFNWIGP
jgi:hypothetical protein